MKKPILFFTVFILSVSVQAQTCDERVDKLLRSVGSFSAATLYNTYAVLGSISDGFAHDAYDAATINDLMNAQQTLSDNLINVMRQLTEKKIFIAQSDIDYAADAINILAGLKSQAQLMKEYSSTRKKQKLNEYEDQRNKNWAAISKLMGIEE